MPLFDSIYMLLSQGCMCESTEDSCFYYGHVQDNKIWGQGDVCTKINIFSYRSVDPILFNQQKCWVSGKEKLNRIHGRNLINPGFEMTILKMETTIATFLAANGFL